MASADDSPISGGARKNAAAAAAAPRPPEHGLNCPRCDSPNTKFCYYNNYSLTQPRHFCKTCRRYWTKGGALRNVPVGGGCRKAKKSKSSMPSAMPSRLAPDFSNAMAGGSEPAAGIKFLDGIRPGSADFQLGVIPFSGRVGVASGAGVTSAFGYTIPTGIGGGAYGDNVTCGSSVLSSHHSGGIAASIESLSSINQELHWKLQQQRLAMLFGGEAYSKESSSSTMVAAAAAALPTPLLDGQQESISFQMPKSPRGELCVSNGSKNWFLESSYTNPAAAAAASTSGNNNNSSGSTSNWSGIAAWNDMYHFTALP